MNEDNLYANNPPPQKYSQMTTPPTPQPATNMEEELEAIRNRAEPISAHGYYNNRYLDTKRLLSIVDELMKERDQAKQEYEMMFDRNKALIESEIKTTNQLATAQAQLRRKDEALDKIERLSIGGDVYQAFAYAQEIARAALNDGKEGGR